MPEEPSPAIPLPAEEPEVAGVPEDIDTEKSSILRRLTTKVIGPDDDFTVDEFRKRLKKDKACKNLLNFYLQKARDLGPTPDQIRLKVDLVEMHYRDLLEMLNYNDLRVADMESLWAKLKARVMDLKSEMTEEHMTTIRVKLGSRFLAKNVLPVISIASLRSRLEKQTGIELSPPPHSE